MMHKSECDVQIWQVKMSHKGEARVLTI